MLLEKISSKMESDSCSYEGKWAYILRIGLKLARFQTHSKNFGFQPILLKGLVIKLRRISILYALLRYVSLSNGSLFV